MGLVPLCFNPGVVGDGRLSACGSRTGSTLSWGHTGSSVGGTCPSRLDATPSPSSPSKPAQAQVPHLNVVEGQRLEGGGVLPLQPQHRLQHQGGVCSAWAVGCGAHGECCCMASHCQPLAKHVVPARTCQPGSPSMLPAAPPSPSPSLPLTSRCSTFIQAGALMVQRLRFHSVCASHSGTWASRLGWKGPNSPCSEVGVGVVLCSERQGEVGDATPSVCTMYRPDQPTCICGTERAGQASQAWCQMMQPSPRTVQTRAAAPSRSGCRRSR